MEASPGVFIGNLSARVRTEIWETTCENLKNGRALLVESTNNEQGYKITSWGHHWKPDNWDGLTLLRRPNQNYQDSEELSSKEIMTGSSGHGWSIAARRRRFKRSSLN